MFRSRNRIRLTCNTDASSSYNILGKVDHRGSTATHLCLYMGICRASYRDLPWGPSNMCSLLKA